MSRGRALPVVLMFASGAAALGYQSIWTQQCALWLGHENAAVLAVVAAFFGGLGLGARLLGARVERAEMPARAYALCESIVAAWGVVLLVALRPWGDALLALTGPAPSAAWQWFVSFGGVFVALLPATAAMGATLPAAQAMLRASGTPTRSVATLYAANTAGAVVGVLGVTFLLAPRVGLSTTAAICAAVNAACALLAMKLPVSRAGPLPARRAPPRSNAAGRHVLPRLFATGLLGIGYEVLVVRVLGQVTEETVYTFALLLAVYLVGTAGGAAAWHRRPQPVRGGETSRLLAWLAAACMAGLGALYAAGWMAATLHESMGRSSVGALVAEAALAVVAFGPACLVMGALFAALADETIAAGRSYATALSVNTAGAALAPLSCGVVLVPSLGPKGALLGIAAGYLALAGAAAWRRAWPVAAAIAATAAIAPPLAFVDVPPGGRVLYYRDGVRASVSVVEDGTGTVRLRIDDRQQEGSSSTLRVDGRQAWLPLLLHPEARRVLFLGLGTGVTSAAAAERPGLDVTAVELLPEVADASHRFDDVVSAAAAARRHVRIADARRFVRANRQTYDVIVADNFHPARSGAGALYTVEHFRAVRSRLAPHGLFCQWLPLHQLDLGSLGSIVAAFRLVWPQAQAVLANNGLETPVIGLIGREGGSSFDAADVRRALREGGPPRGAAWYGFDDELAVLGSVVAGPEALKRFAAGMPPNTDDLPIVSHRAPWVTYRPEDAPADRLLAFVARAGALPAEVLGAATLREEPGLALRLERYWRARDRFLAAGRGVHPSGNVRELLAQVESPLLEVLRVSADFGPAREPLQRMADALAQSDPVAARALRTRIADATSTAITQP